MIKKLFTSALLIASLAALSSCKGDDPMQGYTQNVTQNLETFGFTDGVWSAADLNNSFICNNFRFSHSISEWETIEGFTPANLTDNQRQEPLYAYQFNIIPAHNAAEGPYIVGFWSSREGSEFSRRSLSIARIDGVEFIPDHFYATNTCYAYYTMRDGDAFAQKFQQGDWFKLIIHGVHADGSESTLDFFLANMTSDNGDIVNSWRHVNLRPLGAVTGLYFTMESSDSGQFGMNTPAYFAIRDFQATTLTNAPHESKIF